MKLLCIGGLALLTITSISCSKKDSGSSHTVTVRLTDNPYDAEEVNVDIRSVQLKYNDDENTNDDGWYSIDTDDKVYNLLALQNDVNVVLATGPYPYNRIHEIRLLLGDSNSIKIGNVLYPLTVPSGNSSGFKIKVDKDLSQPLTDILLDFDAGLSVHETGDGKYMLRPVLHLK